MAAWDEYQDDEGYKYWHRQDTGESTHVTYLT